jgi:acetolactate synthase regulatory subunit
LDIRARICSELMPRVLGIVAQHGAIPTTIDYVLDEDEIRVAITVDVGEERIAVLMANAMHRILSIETVTVADGTGQPLNE